MNFLEKVEDEKAEKAEIERFKLEKREERNEKEVGKTREFFEQSVGNIEGNPIHRKGFIKVRTNDSFRNS